MLPGIILRMSGLSGSYDLPCDWIHLGSAAVGTIIFALIYVTLTVRVSQARHVGAGMGLRFLIIGAIWPEYVFLLRLFCY